uniref:Uncharacterized protein n=1 Tax=Cucumis melo TaxID=3656 RepID=A0A9I9ECW2_CUCME
MEESEERCTSMPFLVFIFRWCHDIGHEQAANKPLLKTVMMRLFSPHKTTLMFVIRDKTRMPLENLESVIRGCT